MNTDTIREILKKEPFEPFALLMSNGERHEIRHPEFAMVSPSRLVILDPVTDRLSILSLLHVAEIQMIHPTARAS
ncbi:MAG: hypothetical protein WBC44_02415 [Planctomycetaceae bacterium]